MVRSAEKVAECVRKGSTPTDNTELVCNHEVASGDADTNGIEIAANELSLRTGATLKNGAGTLDALLNRSTLAQQGGHKVDRVRPTAP